jgi:hypothetical protein
MKAEELRTFLIIYYLCRTKPSQTLSYPSLIMPRAKDTKKATTDSWLLLAVVLSGAVALGYEMMWTRLLSLVVGGELLGILGVLAGFFGGMAIGAFSLSKRAAKSKSPLKVFFILEGAIALYGLSQPISDSLHEQSCTGLAGAYVQ